MPAVHFEKVVPGEERLAEYVAVFIWSLDSTGHHVLSHCLPTLYLSANKMCSKCDQSTVSTSGRDTITQYVFLIILNELTGAWYPREGRGDKLIT